MNIRCAKYNRDQFHIAQSRQNPAQQAPVWYPLQQKQLARVSHRVELIRDLLRLNSPETVTPWYFTPHPVATVPPGRAAAWVSVCNLFSLLPWAKLLEAKALEALRSVSKAPGDQIGVLDFQKAQLHRKVPDGRSVALLDSGYIMWLHFNATDNEMWVFAEVHASMRTATPHFVLIHFTRLDQAGRFIQGQSKMDNDCGCEQGYESQPLKERREGDGDRRAKTGEQGDLQNPQARPILLAYYSNLQSP